MGEIIFAISDKFNIPPFITQAILLVIMFVAYVVLSPGKMNLTITIIFGVVSLIVIIITAVIHGKRYFKKPSDW
ncbi:hypothetical protein OAM12_00780 [Candidatus Pelagibacter sp.]|nr:hypothetical protein [Candidatus Pelagibacter sp.]